MLVFYVFFLVSVCSNQILSEVSR